jgi:hypothetical protein
MEGSSGRPAPAKNAWNAGPGGPARAAACDVLDGRLALIPILSLSDRLLPNRVGRWT